MLPSRSRPPQIRQVVIRNKGVRGYEPVVDELDEPDDDLVLLLIPRSGRLSGRNYFYRGPFGPGRTLVKLVLDDGVDSYGRAIGKAHSLVMDDAEFDLFGGLLYFASPLWLGTVNLAEDRPLTPQDFSTKLHVPPKIHLSVPTILETLLTHEYTTLLVDPDHPDHLLRAQITATYVDLCLPPQLRPLVTVKGLVAPSQSDLANLTVVVASEDEWAGVDHPKDLAVIRFADLSSGAALSTDVPPIVEELVQNALLFSERRATGELMTEPREALRDPRIPLTFYSQFADRAGLKLPWNKRFIKKRKD